MAKRLKRPKGFYKELKSLGGVAKQFKVIEFWLQHSKDPSKDIHFYVNWNAQDEISKAFDYMGLANKDDYSDHTLLKPINVPKTRRAKAIYKSYMSSLKHLSEIS